ncbi:nitrate/nitrite transporter NrtS [Hoeflea poritis]|uniref:Nitrate/nitrite transporter NrtS n=1 Tax=Hoeflea poritis TaxID=2993659 RepID=A0ABT4VIW8_9HYPH|nr:nitrate/nitrite transporter NrtS [Hoeflea poritis]MDA4844072.1 nitrate/nitrite transporter NrtS [Hoeflea poritis]
MSNTLRLAVRADIAKRSFFVALVVGTVLNLINQGDAIIGSETFSMTKCIMTYLVPYCVATYGAVGALNAKDSASTG